MWKIYCSFAKSENSFIEMKKSPKILILGATGMLGHTVYKYLKNIFKNSVLGTSRNNFDCYNYQQALPELFSTHNPKYIINCIGILRKSSSSKDMLFINGEFPHILFKYSKKYSFNIIHVSTDAVFRKTSGLVNEDSKASPNDDYGLSKLSGEVKNDNVLNVRTSILGFDPTHHKGLFEWLLKNKSKTISGFTNQLWSGCTTLQLAQFVNWIISEKNFQKLRKISHVFHFPAIGPITKYEILKSFIRVSKQDTVIKKSKGRKITRTLITKYANEIDLNSYKRSVDDTIRELFIFEQRQL